MTMKKVIRDIIDTMDSAGHEFKKGFSGAFRARGGKHRADADAIRDLDRKNAKDAKPKHRADKPTSHAKKYDILTDVTKGREQIGRTGKHADPDYDAARDLGASIAKEIRAVPGDILDEIKGAPKKVPQQFIEELYEDAIGQGKPDAYGEKAPGQDMKFLAPASEIANLAALSTAQLESRLGLEAGALKGADVEINLVDGTRFASIEIDFPHN